MHMPAGRLALGRSRAGSLWGHAGWQTTGSRGLRQGHALEVSGSSLRLCPFFRGGQRGHQLRERRGELVGHRGEETGEAQL